MATVVAASTDTPFVIAGRALRSRLIVGTGKYRSNEEMVRAIVERARLAEVEVKAGDNLEIVHFVGGG